MKSLTSFSKRKVRNNGKNGNVVKKDLSIKAISKNKRSDSKGKIGKIENTVDYSNDWEDPVFFDDFQLSEISSDFLPSPFKEFAKALSCRLETPESAAVLCVLSVLSTALQNKFKIQVEADYSEPLNLYLMVAMPPANRKSAILKSCIKPIIDYEEREQKRLEPIIRRLRSIYFSQKKLIDNERKTLTSQKVENGAIEEIAAKEATLSEPPSMPKLFLTDATTESLSLSLLEQGGKISILSDEGGILDTCSGLYTGGSTNIDVLLKGWDGGNLCIKRKDREVYLKPTISIFMIVQPVIFENMAKNKNYVGKGFFERFLFCEPKSKIGYRTHQGKAISSVILRDYETQMKDLLEIPTPLKPTFVKISKNAIVLWSQFQNEIELDLRKGGVLETCQGWGGKLCGQTLRIAGLLQLSQGYSKDAVVGEDAMQNAIAISKALISHAVKIFDNFILSSDNRIKEAQYVWNAIKSLNKATFTQREITFLLRHKMLSERIKELVCVLIERNLISDPIKSPNGKTITYFVNPKAWEGGDD